LPEHDTDSRKSTLATELRSEVESRLAVHEPDVDVLLVELIGSGRSAALRLFIDSPEGVDHDLCARVTNHLRDLLADYTVEVSSPGPSRPLTKPHHYERFVGHRVRVRTHEPIEGKSEFKGELLGVDEHGVSLGGEWGTVTIPYERIRRSNLVPEPMDVPRRPR
jgi:ribosome maturation factor RimP